MSSFSPPQTTDSLISRALSFAAPRVLSLQGAGAVGVVGLTLFMLKRQLDDNKRITERIIEAQKEARMIGSVVPPSQERKPLDLSKFFRELKTLLRIVLPRVQSRQFFLLVTHTFLLVSRTFLSIAVVEFNGRLVKTIVDRDQTAFTWELAKWLMLAVPATYVNSMIRYLEKKLAISFRTRLASHLYTMYVKNETYYRVENLDSRIANADQCLTEDVSKFCENLAHLWSQFSKPVLDLVVTIGQLGVMYRRTQEQNGKTGGGALAVVIGVGTVIVSGYILRYVSPPFGRMVAEQARLEGELRFVHSRMITNAEEIAFYGGEATERNILDTAYTTLVKHMNYLYKMRIFYNMLEGFLLKYVWSSCGLLMIALPAFRSASGGQSTQTASDRTQLFVTSSGLLTSVADAIERMMSSYKEMTELAGYTSRVHELMVTLDDVSNGVYSKDAAVANASVDLSKRGEVIESDSIVFDNVPIITPNGDVLVESLNFRIAPGEHLLITGPNGCGKSSMFRVLGGLWPIYAGKLCRPSPGQLYYIPQRPYMAIGTLRDQVIYPDTYEDMQAKGLTDAYLDELMDVVSLKGVIAREGGWDTRRDDWQDVLSGGEKQRLAMSRLFYQSPKYAILDECTSAVSVDVEGRMYQYARDSNITLLTVSHRHTLWKYHDMLLQFDGQGGYVFKELNANARLSLKEEKTKLEQHLIDVPKAQRRLAELCALLGEDSTLAAPATPADVESEAELE